MGKFQAVGWGGRLTCPSMWPEVLEDGRTWVMYALWFDDNWNQWQFNTSEIIKLDGASFEKATYELLKKAKPAMDDDGDNQRVDQDVERWRRLSLGLPARRRRTVPFVERTYRRHAPYRWTSEAQFSFLDFHEEDWKALTRAGYALAKADGAFHPAEDRKLGRWWESGARKSDSIMGRLFALSGFESSDASMSKEEAMAQWDRQGIDEEFCTQLESMPFDKRIRFCQLLHSMAKADGEVVEAEMEVVRQVAKLLRVNLKTVGCPMPVEGPCGMSSGWRRQRETWMR